MLVKRLVTCSEWGYPMDSWDLRLVVKGYLDRRDVTTKLFKGNLPGKDLVWSFLYRQQEHLRPRLCENIKRARAGVTIEAANSFFDNITEVTSDVPPSNIMSYDETNLADDPGRKKVIVKKMQAPRTSHELIKVISLCHLMWCTRHCTCMAAGQKVGLGGHDTVGALPDGLTCTHRLVCQAGPASPGIKAWKKVLIGDNLSSHLSAEVIREKEVTLSIFHWQL